MKKSIIIGVLTMLVLLALALTGCKKDAPQPTFDRSQFLQNQADTELRSRTSRCTKSAQILRTSVETFCSDPTATSLLKSRQDFTQAYEDWQSVNFMNFGIGAKEGLRLSIHEEVGSFPIDVEKIHSLIEEGNNEVVNPFRNTRGLLAIEYLLYHPRTSEAYLSDFSEKKKGYMRAVMMKVVEQLKTVSDAWGNESYRSEFAMSNGTDSKSSTTVFYNEWLRSFELLKNMKISEPLGRKAGQSHVHPELVEAPYSEMSARYALAHFRSIKDVFHDGPSAMDTISWVVYLNSVEGGSSLATKISAQMKKVESAFLDLPDSESLKDMVRAEDPRLLLVEQEMQILTPLMKSEMSSLLGLAITFSTTDGD